MTSSESNSKNVTMKHLNWEERHTYNFISILFRYAEKIMTGFFRDRNAIVKISSVENKLPMHLRCPSLLYFLERSRVWCFNTRFRTFWQRLCQFLSGRLTLDIDLLIFLPRVVFRSRVWRESLVAASLVDHSVCLPLVV